MATAPTGPTTPVEETKPEPPPSGKVPFENLTYVSTTLLSADKSPVVVKISDLDEETASKVKKEYEG